MDAIFAEAAERERQLLGQLAACPIVEMTGAVSASGAAAVKARGQEQWTLQFTFDAWRVGAGPMKREPVTVRRKVPDGEARGFQERVLANTILRIRARVAEENVFGSPQALLEGIVELGPSDPELERRLAELQEPVTHEDGVFGTLTLDRRVRWHTGNAAWNGIRVELNIAGEDSGELRAGLDVAHAIWSDQGGWDERVRDYAARQLLPVKNEHWLEEDEAEVSLDEFRRRMVVESVTVYAAGKPGTPIGSALA